MPYFFRCVFFKPYTTPASGMMASIISLYVFLLAKGSQFKLIIINITSSKVTPLILSPLFFL